MKNLLVKLLLPKPIKGEPVNYKKQKKHTVMPCDSITLLKWHRGEWSDFINNKRNG